ncbi:MAG: hypothetical protein KF911_06380 [Pseudomonadales bacterium]|nr:hypothetical protein [Pseudomonadales bacterium]
MYELLVWLEESMVGGALRGAGVWAYGWLNLVHILGIATLFGSVLVLDLRLLGLFRDSSIEAIARPTVPLAALGFAVAATSGAAMITVNASEYAGNPYLYVKLPAILVGLLNVVVVQRLAAWRHALAGAPLEPGERRALAFAGGCSLLIWLTVVGCGRMIGYW